MTNCKSCQIPFQVQTEGYHSGLCDKCKALAKAWLLANPVLRRLFEEYGRRYGKIWTD